MALGRRRATTYSDRPSRMTMARSRGAVNGPLLMLFGAWGAIVPFIGHYFSYGFTPDNTWTWTAARGWLEVAPGAAAFVGGFLLMVAGERMTAMIGGWLAAAAGAWFILGPIVQPWWSPGFLGIPSGSPSQGVWEWIGMFYGVGIVTLLCAAMALGRASVVGLRDMDAAIARRDRNADLTTRDTAGTTTGTTDTTATTTEPTTTADGAVMGGGTRRTRA